MWWRRRRDGGIVVRLEQARQIGERSTASRDIEHRSDKKSHHAMQETVGFDFEHQSTWPFPPTRVGDATAMIVVRGCGPTHGKAAEAVFAFQLSGCRIEGIPIQGLPNCELVPTTKWRVRLLIRTDVIAIPPAHSTEPRMKLVPHFNRFGDPHVGGEDCVQRAAQLLNVFPSIRDPNAY